MGGIDWESLPEDEGLQLLTAKLCELDLIPPDRCESPTSQASD